ncbi:hypothetical protein DPMN_053629 [Dreissena polymorpha]|uniref:Uncharacterized protein n=1 Tax=Dreissena polymorpha TaxID=45954 RepID=A0A9D4CP51_DREPO|nr:hypothetical protein DPMN_053629 [Dreissena polymorpha]
MISCEASKERKPERLQQLARYPSAIHALQGIIENHSRENESGSQQSHREEQTGFSAGR